MINYIEKGWTMHAAIADAGLSLYEVDGVWVTHHDEATVQQFIDEYVPDVSTLMVEINAECEKVLQSLRIDYPTSEIYSWDKQEQEARAGGGPLTDALAASRGVPADLLRQKIIEKADAYAAACGHIIGVRQRLEDRLKAGDYTATWPTDLYDT